MKHKAFSLNFIMMDKLAIMLLLLVVFDEFKYSNIMTKIKV